MQQIAVLKHSLVERDHVSVILLNCRGIFWHWCVTCDKATALVKKSFLFNMASSFRWGWFWSRHAIGLSGLNSCTLSTLLLDSLLFFLTVKLLLTTIIIIAQCCLIIHFGIPIPIPGPSLSLNFFFFRTPTSAATPIQQLLIPTSFALFFFL